MNTKKALDFNVIRFRYSEDEDSHEIFVKEHLSKTYDEEKPIGRTLFVINIPPYVNEENLHKVFSEVASVTSVKLQKGIPRKDEEHTSNSYQSGYIVFEESEGLKTALNTTALSPLLSEGTKIPSALKRYAQEYNTTVFNHRKLYEETTEAIRLYDKKEQERKNKDKEQVDDEGWIVVTKKGRNPGLANKESVDKKLHELHKEKMKKKTLQNFYSFQIRESKRKHLAALRQQHEEAKRKIEEMKKTRTFRPY